MQVECFITTVLNWLSNKLQRWSEVSVSLRADMGKSDVTLAANTINSRKVLCCFACHRALGCFTLDLVPEALVPLCQALFSGAQ